MSIEELTSLLPGFAIKIFLKAIQHFINKAEWIGYFVTANEEVSILSDEDIKKVAIYTYKSNTIKLIDNIIYELKLLGVNEEETAKFLYCFVRKTQVKHPLISIIYDLRHKCDKTQIDDVIQKINSVKASIESQLRHLSFFNIDEIDHQLKEYSYTKCNHQLGIDFYNLQDPLFEQSLSNVLATKRDIIIYGKYYKETLYALLYELKTIYKENYVSKVYVFDSVSNFEHFKENIEKDSIVVANVANDDCFPKVSNFITIRITTNEIEKKNSCILRNRLFKNTSDMLINHGFSSEEARNVLQRTGNRFPLLFRELYDYTDKYLTKITRNITNKSFLMFSLLAPNISINNDIDMNFVKKVLGVSFVDYKNCLTPPQLREAPLVNEKKDWMDGTIMSTAIIKYHEMYIDLFEYSDIEVFNSYIKRLPKFFKEYITNEYVDKRSKNYSTSFLEGILTSLSIIYFYGKKEIASKVKDFIVKLLKIAEKDEFYHLFLIHNLSFLIEIAPEKVLSILKNNVKNKNGIYQFFIKEKNVYGGNPYTKVLWGLEKLFFVTTYRQEAIVLCFELARIKTEYKMTNSPINTLSTLLAAWIHTTNITIEDKKNFVLEFFDKDREIAFSLCSKLVYVSGDMVSPFNPPKYLYYDRFDEKTNTDEAYELYRFYAKTLLSNAKTISDWKVVLDKHVTLFFNDDEKRHYYNKMVSSINVLTDDDKEIFYIELKKFIHNNRRFCDTDWAADNNELTIIEEVMENISFKNENRKYTYLYYSEYDTYTEHPIPYRNSNDDYKNNKAYSEKQLIANNDALLQQNVDCFDLFKLVLSRSKMNNKFPSTYIYNLVIAYYKNNGHTLEEALVAMLKEDVADIFFARHIGFFVLSSYGENLIYSTIGDLVGYEPCNEKIVYFAFPLKFNINDNQFISLIENIFTDEQRSIYYKHLNEYNDISTDIKTLDYLLNGIKNSRYKKGEKNKYVSVLAAFIHKYPNMLSPIQLLNYLLDVDERIIFNRSDSYDLVEVIQYIQKGIMDLHDTETENKVAILEIKYLLKDNPEDCIFVKNALSRDANMYCDILGRIYSSNESDNESKYYYHELLFAIEYTLHFCPGYIFSHFDKDIFNKWIKDFKKSVKALNNINLKKQVFLYYQLGKVLGNCKDDESDSLPVPIPIREFIEGIKNEKNLDIFISDFICTVRNTFAVRTVSNGDDLCLLADKNQKYCEKLKDNYPNTALIFYRLAQDYRADADEERKRAEDE